MNSPAMDVKDLFEDSAFVVGVFGTNLFVGNEPELPDACVTIYDAGGADTEPTTEFKYEYPNVSIRVRGAVADYTGAYTKAAEIKYLLHCLVNRTINGTKYISFFCIGDIQFLQGDEKNRPIFLVNLRMQRTAA